MYEIVFKYADAASKWKWRKQTCVLPSVEECIRLYGLGIDCKYQILSVKEVKT